MFAGTGCQRDCVAARKSVEIRLKNADQCTRELALPQPRLASARRRGRQLTLSATSSKQTPDRSIHSMTDQDSKMPGKRVLVTGSGTGIGREIALEFAREGADVVVHYAHDEKGALAAVDEIRAMGRRAEAFKADFDRVEEAVRLGEQAIRCLGGLDCLVNNSGIT